MTIDIGQLSPSEQNEQIVREYFEARPDWTVTKLDKGKEQAADFRICYNGNCFLCEVKTVESDRASFPYTPIEYYLKQRKKRRDEIEKWLEENPGKRLILHKEDREFIYGDEIQFQKRHRHKRRNTKKWFDEFSRIMLDYFRNSIVKDLPYTLRLDSQDLYAPTPNERDTFFQWLESEILAISKGEHGWCWRIERWSSHATLYTASYQIHKPTHENDTKAVYQLMLVGPYGAGPLEMNIHSYGVLNLDRITSTVEDGLRQLESSALREEDRQTPRIIALVFESGIHEWRQLASCITGLLKEHPNLSAIAVLQWTPDGIPPPQEDGLSAWYEFYLTTPAVPCFIVYHNSWLQGVKPLPVCAFEDKWSVQLSPTLYHL